MKIEPSKVSTYGNNGIICPFVYVIIYNKQIILTFFVFFSSFDEDNFLSHFHDFAPRVYIKIGCFHQKYSGFGNQEMDFQNHHKILP